MGCVGSRNAPELESLRSAILTNDVSYVSSDKSKPKSLDDARKLIYETVNKETSLEMLDSLIVRFNCRASCLYKKLGPERITLDIISDKRNGLEEYEIVGIGTNNPDVFNYCLKKSL